MVLVLGTIMRSLFRGFFCIKRVVVVMVLHACFAWIVHTHKSVHRNLDGSQLIMQNEAVPR